MSVLVIEQRGFCDINDASVDHLASRVRTVKSQYCSSPKSRCGQYRKRITYQLTSVLLLAIGTVPHFGQIFSSPFGEKKTIHIVIFCPGRTADVKCTLTLKSRPFAPSWKIYCRRFTSSYPGRPINLSQSTV
jgi:hypothetical protein